MKKEVFLAVFVGFVLGLIITFGIWTANKSLRTPPPVVTPTPEVSPSPTPASQNSSAVSLTVTSPEDESISSDSTITLTGKTGPGLPVSVTWENSQTLIVSDATGNFEADIKLEGGYNRLTVTVTDASGNSATKELLVTYTTSKI